MSAVVAYKSRPVDVGRLADEAHELRELTRQLRFRVETLETENEAWRQRVTKMRRGDVSDVEAQLAAARRLIQALQEEIQLSSAAEPVPGPTPAAAPPAAAAAALPPNWFTRQERRCLEVILTRLCADSAAFRAGGAIAGNCWGRSDQLAVLMTRIRTKLRPFGVSLLNVRRLGYYVPEADRPALRALLGQGAAEMKILGGPMNGSSRT